MHSVEARGAAITSLAAQAWASVVKSAQAGLLEEVTGVGGNGG